MIMIQPQSIIRSTYKAFIAVLLIRGSVCFIPSQSSFSNKVNKLETRHQKHLSFVSRAWSRSSDARNHIQNTASRSSLVSRFASLKPLVEEITAFSAKSNKPKTIFVGGKGGVGKTTVSSALAVELAQQDLKVLIVSTDPAHSLGDALDEDLRKGNGRPVIMTDPLTGGRLHAAEINAEAALQEFRENLESFNFDRLAGSLGVSPDLLESLGLREFSALLNNPPPGLDELVALGNVMFGSSSDAANEDYDVIIVDTAPTGHTLRLLSLPKFLDGLLGKLIALRMKLSGLASTLQAFMGDAEAQQRTQTIDNAMNKLDQFRTKISNLEKQLKDNTLTNFMVVTVPTKLAIEESARLMSELKSQSIAVNNIVVNQCVGDIEDDGSEALSDYYKRRRAGQTKWIGKLKESTDEVSKTPDYKSNGNSGPIGLTEIPFYDVELVGVPALGYVGSQEFVDNPNFRHLMERDGYQRPKVIICGGKGGVGKTTTSASLAVTMAAQGHNVALISTDPAHSLGDAIDMNLVGGSLIDCPLVGVPSANVGEGSLSVMEVDPSQALGQFKGTIDSLIGGGTDNSDIRNTLKELEEVFDTLPPGTDEIVALAKVMKLVKKGNFDRIVLDTAPTGHTLRMLSTPGFLAMLIDRVLLIAQKVNSNSMVKMFIASAAQGNAEEVEAAGSAAKSKLLSYQLQMFELEDMFSNADQTEFLIVTIPTELAVRESVRLLNDLTFEDQDFPIKVRNVVVNQVLGDDGSDVKTFLAHVSDGQKASIQNLKQSLTQVRDDPPSVTTVPYLDTEPRGVFGLKVLAEELLREAD